MPSEGLAGAGATEDHKAVPAPLVVNDELARATARRLVVAVEWSSPIFLAAMLLWSVQVDPYRPGGDVAVVVLAAAHLLVLVPVYARGNGPFGRGGAWLAAPALQCVAVNVLLAWLALPGTFGTDPISLPGGAYFNGILPLLALYPWLPPALARYKVAIEVAIITLYVAYILLLVELFSGSLDAQLVWSGGNGTFMWLLVGYILGKAGGMLCLRAARSQVEVQQRSFQEFFDFLHSHVQANIAMVRAELPVDAYSARQKLAELETAVSRYRVELLLAQERPPLAALFSERVRAFTGTLRIERTPRIGGMTVSRPVGVLVSRALGDLLKNAAVHGADAVSIDFETTDDTGRVAMTISDNGPGFSASVLDDEQCSLFRLRAASRNLGGDLQLLAHGGVGSTLKLTVPLADRQ